MFPLSLPFFLFAAIPVDVVVTADAYRITEEVLQPFVKQHSEYEFNFFSSSDVFLPEYSFSSDRLYVFRTLERYQYSGDLVKFARDPIVLDAERGSVNRWDPNRVYGFRGQYVDLLVTESFVRAGYLISLESGRVPVFTPFSLRSRWFRPLSVPVEIYPELIGVYAPVGWRDASLWEFLTDYLRSPFAARFYRSFGWLPY